MEKKLEKAGFNKVENRFIAAIGSFLKDGGTKERAIKLVLKVAGGGKMESPSTLWPKPSVSRPYTPRVIPKEQIEERRALIESAISKFKNSFGV